MQEGVQEAEKELLNESSEEKLRDEACERELVCSEEASEDEADVLAGGVQLWQSQCHPAGQFQL